MKRAAIGDRVHAVILHGVVRPAKIQRIEDSQKQLVKLFLFRDNEDIDAEPIDDSGKAGVYRYAKPGDDPVPGTWYWPEDAP